MAESADILTGDHQQVLLPDLNAGCSMADMADIDRSRRPGRPWPRSPTSSGSCPITYMNSSAALKAFVGAPRRRGVHLVQRPGRAHLGPRPRRHRTAQGDKVLFFPDQHLGRNTGYQLGYGAADMAVWNPRLDLGGLDDADVKSATAPAVEGPLLGPPAVPARARRGLPGRAPRRHRAGPPRVRPRGGRAGRPGRLDRRHHPGRGRGAGRARSSASATEIHLVKRLDDEHPDKTVVCLDPLVCPCSTMSRIDAAHLAWVLEGLVDGEVRNRITVDDETAEWARVALERMLAIT